jgi:hypothetical protein
MADIINRSDRRIMIRYTTFITLHYHDFRFVCLFLFLCLFAFLFASVQRRSDVAPTSQAEAARLGLDATRDTNVCIREYTDH